MKVALIIGHKKTEQGAKNSDIGITEFMFNSLLVKDIITYYEKTSDNSLELIPVFRDTYRNLPKKVNSTNADIILSFHCNAFNTKVSGSEVLYYHKSSNGKKIAKSLQNNIVNALGLKDRGIKGKSSKDLGGYLLKYTSAPCVILEPFFIDNNSDCFVARMEYGKLVINIIKSILEIQVSC